MTIIERLLKNSRTVAIVGLSSDEERPSYHVGSYLKEHGYTVIPVNPNEDTVIGEKSYPDLVSVPVKVDLVDIFRKAEDVPPVVDEAIEIGAKAVWMQLGIVNRQAAAKARKAGLTVVMNRCMFREYERLFGSGNA